MEGVAVGSGSGKDEGREWETKRERGTKIRGRGVEE